MGLDARKGASPRITPAHTLRLRKKVSSTMSVAVAPHRAIAQTKGGPGWPSLRAIAGAGSRLALRDEIPKEAIVFVIDAGGEVERAGHRI